jgi:hypothetical protein
MRRLLTSWAMASIALLTPALALGSDQELAQQIAGNLKNSGRLKGYSISVKVQGNVVQLDGTVRSDEQLEQALSLAEATPGIERVVNNLAVKQSGAARAPETTLALRQPKSIASGEKQIVRRTSRPTVTSAVRQATAEMPDEQSLAPPQYDAPPPMPAAMMQQPRMQQGPVVRGAPRPIQRTAAVQGAAHMQMQHAQMQHAPEMIPPGAPGADHMGHAGHGPVSPAAGMGGPMPAYAGAVPVGMSPARYDQPHMPGYAWPSYAAYPNYAALTYPKQYSPTAWPFIGPFYPYPQVPLGWRKVSLEWDNGWWMLDFKDSH